MLSTMDIYRASSSRPLGLRRRPDLCAEKQIYQGRAYWVVKEPIGLHYFRFQEKEYAILRWLDGHVSLDEIKRRLDAEYPPERTRLEEIARFVGRLHQSGLITSSAPGQGEQLLRRSRTRRNKQRLAALGNVLAIRFRGVDPERFLKWLYPQARWFFSPGIVVLCCLLAVAAVMLIAVQFDVFRARLPAFHDFFAVQNWIWLALVLGATKILHELGHGLACKHFGGECHEMGVMILVLTPCLYCDVSDSWMLPNKWQRAAIGAAGMYVELLIASLGTFVWWFTADGLINQLSLYAMFICSVSMILFNGNPLLRYDGYYILSDLLEIPNLRQKSSAILNRKLGAWCLGLNEPEDPFLPRQRRWLFALYSVAAVVYRWFVVLAILWFLYKVFEPYGLKIIGQAIVLVALYGLVIQPLGKLMKFLRVPGRLQKIRPLRVYATLGVAIAAIVAVLFVPLPHAVICTLEIQPHEAAQVYVSTAGRLEQLHVRQGQKVEEGTPLAQLGNRDLELQVVRLEGLRDEYQAELKSLRRERFRDDQASRDIPRIQETLASVEEQLAQKKRDWQRLRLVAPQAGTVMPPPLRADTANEDTLPTWTGTPLQEKNLGALLDEGELFCQIGDPRSMEALLVVNQEEIEFVQPGQAVEIKLDQLPEETFHSTIVEIANLNLQISPRHLSAKAGGALATRTDRAGRERPRTASYQARALLADEEGILRIGLRGRAKIHTPAQSLGKRIWRFLNRTFSFRL